MSAKSSLLTVSQDEINWARQNSIFIAHEDRAASLYNAEKRGLERGMQKGLEQGMQKGIQQGIQQGQQQGERTAKIETARNALAMGLTIDQIVQITGLNKEELESMQKS